jgi:thiol-disulfide isomerase/thioredoxin
MRRISTTTIVRGMVISSIALMLTNQDRGQSATVKQTATSSAPVSAPKLLGKPAPAFVVTTLDRKQVSLADYTGKALIVNFWATWCGACKLEMPWLAQLREKYASQGFEVLGIVTDGAPTEKVEALAQKYGVKYPILGCNHATAQAYGGLPDLPESFFIDRHGRIVAEIDGADSKEQIEANIRTALQY